MAAEVTAEKEVAGVSSREIHGQKPKPEMVPFTVWFVTRICVSTD